MLKLCGEPGRADLQPHLLVQKASRFLPGEGELLGADLVHLPPSPEPPQRQPRIRATCDDEVDVLGEVLEYVGYRFVTAVLGYELVIIEHNYQLMGQPGEIVYKHGKRCLGERLTYAARSHKSIGTEVLFWLNLAHRFNDVHPHPDRIVVLLVQRNPAEGHAGFFCLPPLGQERRLAVARRSTYEGHLAVEGSLQKPEQSRTFDLLRARRRRSQLGLDDDARRMEVWVTRGLDYRLLRPIYSLARSMSDEAASR